MMMRQEEQISRYFDHAMTSSEEQNFLITLAASDGMRIAFRSQLELMKAVRSDADSLRSVAAVRDRTLTALGLSATAVTPFIEQELLRSARSHDAAQAAAQAGSSPRRTPRGVFSKPKYALGTGLFLGFLSAVALMNIATPGHVSQPANAIRVTQPASPAVNPLTKETIPASNDLHTVADERSSSVAGHHRSHGQTSAVSTKTSAMPEVVSSKPARIDVKQTIKKPTDDRSSGENAAKAP